MTVPLADEQEFSFDTSPIDKMDINEFRDFGFLQEVNRIFFHPLGLALEVILYEDGSARLGGVHDYRDDPEGVIYGEQTLDVDKMRRVSALRDQKSFTRRDAFGYVIQPVVPIQSHENREDEIPEEDAGSSGASV